MPSSNLRAGYEQFQLPSEHETHIPDVTDLTKVYIETIAAVDHFRPGDQLRGFVGSVAQSFGNGSSWSCLWSSSTAPTAASSMSTFSGSCSPGILDASAFRLCDSFVTVRETGVGRVCVVDWLDVRPFFSFSTEVAISPDGNHKLEFKARTGQDVVLTRGEQRNERYKGFPNGARLAGCSRRPSAR